MLTGTLIAIGAIAVATMLVAVLLCVISAGIDNNDEWPCEGR